MYTTLHNHLQNVWQKSYRLHRALWKSFAIFFYACACIGAGLMANSCVREPELHLPGAPTPDMQIPMVDLDLETYWDYVLDYGIHYDWRTEWVYGWDSADRGIFETDSIGYTRPEKFEIRRYYTHQEPFGRHTNVDPIQIVGNTLHGKKWNWGYWDVLVWSSVEADVVSLDIDDRTTLDSVTATTNPSMRSSRFQAPSFNRAYWQPEQLFSAYERGIEINQDLKGFDYDSLRNVWVKQLEMILEPVTYIYLTQVILHNNRNKVINVDGDADISGMARYTNVNTGIAGNQAIDVTFKTNLKHGVVLPDWCRDYIDVKVPNEVVDISGGRLLTFGIPGQNGNRIKNRSEVRDNFKHFIDINMHFNNGMDSTFIFDVTEKVRSRWKGGVITIELDMDTIPVPQRSGGSAFDAVVKDYEEVELPEFDM